jgi:hypothetical protein
VKDNAKSEYFAIHDYGTGGLWFIINAHSSKEIVDRFPFLKVVEKRPAWWDENEYRSMRSNAFRDIDEEDIRLLK